MAVFLIGCIVCVSGSCRYRCWHAAALLLAFPLRRAWLSSWRRWHADNLTDWRQRQEQEALFQYMMGATDTHRASQRSPQMENTTPPPPPPTQCVLPKEETLVLVWQTSTKQQPAVPAASSRGSRNKHVYSPQCCHLKPGTYLIYCQSINRSINQSLLAEFTSIVKKNNTTYKP